MISICMIVRDNEDVIESCLRALKPLGYEIIVVDTGSVDLTPVIAKDYTDKVFHYTWDKDFAKARNYAISKAENDIVLHIDSDEIVSSYDKDRIEELISFNPVAVGRILCHNEYRKGDENYCYSERLSRLFSKRLYQYQGKIHEQVVPLSERKAEYYDLPLEIKHRGYDGDSEKIKRKAERNIELLKLQLEEGQDPYILYQLGKSYHMQGEYGEAVEWFDKALWFDLNPKLEYVQDLVETYGYALINSEQYEKALQLVGIYEEFSGSADFVYMMGLVYMNNAKFQQAVQEFRKAAQIKTCKMEGVNSYRAYYNMGVIFECLGQKPQAKECYRRCGEYQLARQRLDSMI